MGFFIGAILILLCVILDNRLTLIANLIRDKDYDYDEHHKRKE